MTKTLKLLTGIVGLSLTASVSSCGLQGTVVRADDYDAETIVDLMNEEEPIVSVPTHTKKPDVTSKKPVSATPLNGEWIIIEVKGMDINEDTDMPYVIFSDAEGRFYASNGCNYINGSFSYKNNNILSFNHIVTTLRDCPDISYPNAISKVLNDGVTVKTKIEDKSRESYLYLYGTNDELLLTLRRHNLEVINGQWEVALIGKEEVDGSEVNLFFDVPERSIHGNTGCNFFNGVIVINPEVPSSLSFSQMGVTMKYCDNADIERMLLVALEETETYSLKDSNTLFLNDADGKTLITLKKK